MKPVLIFELLCRLWPSVTLKVDVYSILANTVLVPGDHDSSFKKSHSRSYLSSFLLVTARFFNQCNDQETLINHIDYVIVQCLNIIRNSIYSGVQHTCQTEEAGRILPYFNWEKISLLNRFSLWVDYYNWSYCTRLVAILICLYCTGNCKHHCLWVYLLTCKIQFYMAIKGWGTV